MKYLKSIEQVNEYGGSEFSKITEKFNFSKKEVEAAANLIATAISKADKVKAKVHDLEYVKGKGAGFEISIDGEKYDGGSYTVKDNGDVVNAAIGNSHPNAVYNTIGNKDIADVFINMKKYESVAVGSAIHDVSTELPAKAIALPIEDDEEENGSITEGKDIGSWNQGGLKGNKNVLITTFVGPPAVEEFGLGRKCMQINVGMDYIALNPADIVELKDLLKSYKVK